MQCLLFWKCLLISDFICHYMTSCVHGSWAADTSTKLNETDTTDAKRDKFSGWVCMWARAFADCCVSAFQTHKKRVCYAIKGIMCKAFNHLYGVCCCCCCRCSAIIFPRHQLNYVQSVIREGTHYKCRETNIIVVHAMIQACMYCVFYTFFPFTYCMTLGQRWKSKATKNTLFLRSHFRFSFINIFVLMCSLFMQFQKSLWGTFFVFLFSGPNKI